MRVLLLFLLIFSIEAYIVKRRKRPLKPSHNKIKDSIFTFVKRMGHDYQHCSTFMGYQWAPGSGDEERKCFVSIIKEKDETKLQQFLEYLRIVNLENK